MQIKPVDETSDRVRMIEDWKQMWEYLTPEKPILSEETFDAIVIRDDQTVLSRDFLIAEDNQGLVTVKVKKTQNPNREQGQPHTKRGD